MLRNLDWIHDLNIEYDLSTFDTDPFEPQPEGTGTIFPFMVKNSVNGATYVELPYTLPQDSSLFVIMREKTIDIWKKKLDYRRAINLLGTFNSLPHPHVWKNCGAWLLLIALLMFPWKKFL